jgi:hypothetical protein
MSTLDVVVGDRSPMEKEVVPLIAVLERKREHYAFLFFNPFSI